MLRNFPRFYSRTDGDGGVSGNGVGSGGVGAATEQQGAGSPPGGPPIQGTPAPTSTTIYDEIIQTIPKEYQTALQPFETRLKEIHEVAENFGDFKDYDPEALQQAVQLYQFASENPQGLYDLLKQEYEQQNEPEQEQTPDPELEGVPPQLLERLDKQQQMIEQMAQILVNQQKSTQEQQEDAELDAYLNDLKQRHGDFDEDYVLLKMEQGLDGDKAVSAYQAAIQKAAQTQQQQNANSNVPAVLSGGGSIPLESFDPAKAKSNEVQDFVAKVLEQTARANN